MKKRTLLMTGAVFAMLSISGLALAATGPLDPTKTRIAYPLDVAPVIDGEIDPDEEWALASFRGWMFRVDDVVDDGLLGSELASGDLPTDDGDLSVDVYAGVTEDALYIGVVVVDDDISTDNAAADSENGETWLDDSVEIFIDGDNSNFAERDTTGSNPEVVDTGGQYVITANNAYRHAEAGNPAFGPDAGWFAQTKESADGYHAEFRIPLSQIGNPKRGEFIGFTVAVNDDDGGGEAERQVIWTGLTHVEETYGNLVIGHRQYEGLKASAPTIDGTIGDDEYPGAEVVVINPHTGVYRVGDDDHALDNHGFEWRLTHDEDAIYVAARVTDDNIVADTAEPNSEDGETWIDDSVEIFFDSNESNLQGRDQNEMFDGQFVFTTNGAWRDNEANNPEFGQDKDWFAASTVDGNTWDVEFKILKSALVGGDREDVPMGFNININDDDGAGDRSEQLNWGGSPHNEYTYSELILLSAIPSDPNAVADRNVRFGRLDKNSAQGEETLTIRNAGATETLILSDAALSGPDMDAFTIVDFPESILPGETATAVIAFDSQGVTGSFNATLTYTTNDPDPSEAALAAALSASVLNLGGPAARYALDETEGTDMLDRSGFNRHGTYNGATLGQEGLVSGTSVMFSGGGYAAVPGESLGAFDRFSVAMTVNLADVSESQTLFAKGPENGAPTLALLNSDGTLQWFNDAVPEFGTDDAVLTAGMTHHVAVTWTSTSAAIFVDGVAVVTQDNPDALDIVAEDPLVFGSFFGNLNMNGRLDDVQFYDRAISADDVEFLAANPDDELELDGPIPEPPQFTELWVLGDPTNGNQTEFSQEQGMEEAPGSATAQDDDFYFHGIYPDPIGTVVENEPFVNFDRAHVPGDPFNRIHFNLDADSAAADTQLRMTFALCCFGAAEGLSTEHDMVFRLNGKEVFSDEGINSDRVIEETVIAGDFDVVEGANTIEIERTGGTDGSAWVQYDFVRLEATAGAPVPAPNDGGGGPGDGERPFVFQEVGISASGAFSATLPAGATGDIEYSIDLIEWEVIATGVTGIVEETDADRLAAPEGYYRATVP